MFAWKSTNTFSVVQLVFGRDEDTIYPKTCTTQCTSFWASTFLNRWWWCRSLWEWSDFVVFGWCIWWQHYATTTSFLHEMVTQILTSHKPSYYTQTLPLITYRHFLSSHTQTLPLILHTQTYPSSHHTHSLLSQIGWYGPIVSWTVCVLEKVCPAHN